MTAGSRGRAREEEEKEEVAAECFMVSEW